MTPVRVLYLEDNEADPELVQALLDESRMAWTHPQLDFIAKIAESSTGYSVVGKAKLVQPAHGGGREVRQKK